MVGGEALIVAGIGCRKGCPAEAIVALVREAGGAEALAAPWFKQNEAGLLEAASILGLPLRFVPPEELAWAVPTSRDQLRLLPITRGSSFGWPAVAEGCATAGGGTLVLARIKNAVATCALARHPEHA